MNSNVKDIVCQVIDIYENDLEGALLWLLTPLVALNGLRPVDMIVDEKENPMLQHVIRRLAHGEFP